MEPKEQPEDFNKKSSPLPFKVNTTQKQKPLVKLMETGKEREAEKRVLGFTV